MLNTKQKISFGSVLITFSSILIVILILFQTSEIGIPFYELMFLAGGIILGLGTTLSISGLVNMKNSKVN
jgi:hypothetical protein